MANMKAIRIHSYGGPDVLAYEDIPRPKIAPDELLLRVKAAGVNPVDWKTREGYLKDLLHHQLPFTPGWDVSGTVEEVGPQVATYAVGDSLYAFIDLARGGGYAEFCAVKSTEAAFTPQSLDHIETAAVPLAALTAWQSLFELAGLQAGQRVLIHAAAGGVGHYAVQLAKWAGAHVIGTASQQNHDFLRELGAHDVIDYTTSRFEDIVHDVDVVFDTIGGDTRERSWKVLKKGGILVTTLPPAPSEEITKAHGARAAAVLVQPNGQQLGEIAELIDSGHVKPHMHTVLPLSEAMRAHQLSASGHVRGKIVLKVQ